MRPARAYPIRPASLLTITILALLGAHTAAAVGPFADSPYTQKIPAPGACDARISPGLALGTLNTLLNDPSKRVFCVDPGDYRAAGELFLTASGTEQSRRFLRFDAKDGQRNAVQRPQRAIFESLRLLGDWWVIQGLTIQPQNGLTAWFVTIYGGDHNVLDGNLIDGIQHVPRLATQNAVVVAGYNGDPATFNTLQANVIRNGNVGRRPGDFEGILVAWGNVASEANDFNQILDNEIYDWGDGVAVGGHTSDCSEPGVQHGTVIDGNDVYLTAAKRIDCSTGALDPAGECACAEEGISVKSKAGPDAEDWTRITRNRVWGFRPTSAMANCGGTGANGQAISAGNTCPRHVLVARNTILDSTNGVVAAGSSWIIAGNLIHDIRESDGRNRFTTLAIDPAASASDVRIEFNTVVDVDNSYDDQSANTDTRCNAVIDDRAAMGIGGSRGANHSTESNFLYESPAASFQGNSNEIYANAADSGNTEYCFWRKRWTSPERICIPFANTTPSSTHGESTASCDADLLAPFGMEAISYPSSAVPEPTSLWLGLSSALSLGAFAQRRNRAKRRDR